MSRIRFGFFELGAVDAEVIWGLVTHRAVEQDPTTSTA
jgi:hypothetical protein